MYRQVKNFKNVNNSSSPSDWMWNDSWNSNQVVEENNQTEQPIVVDTGMVANSYQEAIKESGKRGKPVLLFFEMDECGWCRKMKYHTMQNTKLQSVLSKYILYYVDVKKEPNLAKQYSINAVPAYVITNTKEQVLKKGTGYLEVDSMYRWLNQPSLFNQPRLESNNNDNSPSPNNPPRPPRPPRPPG